MEFLYSKNEALVNPGLVIGKVVANYDDNFKGMVQVAFYSHTENANTTSWMRASSIMSGKGKGLYILPDIGDEVIVSFINNDPEHPVVIGTLWNDKDYYPENAAAKENTNKILSTKSGAKIAISDEKDKEQISISTPKNVQINLSDENDSIEILTNDNSNKITIDGKSGNITIQCKNKLSISSKDVQIKADSQLNIDGQNVEIKATSSLKLQSSGTTDLKGSMVNING